MRNTKENRRSLTQLVVGGYVEQVTLKFRQETTIPYGQDEHPVLCKDLRFVTNLFYVKEGWVKLYYVTKTWTDGKTMDWVNCVSIPISTIKKFEVWLRPMLTRKELSSNG